MTKTTVLECERCGANLPLLEALSTTPTELFELPALVRTMRLTKFFRDELGAGLAHAKGLGFHVTIDSKCRNCDEVIPKEAVSTCRSCRSTNINPTLIRVVAIR